MRCGLGHCELGLGEVRSMRVGFDAAWSNYRDEDSKQLYPEGLCT